MQTIVVVLHLFLALGLIGLVLIQHGKGADAGAAFGSGASATVFGARGSASFLTRATAILAASFFVTSMALAYFATQATKAPGLMDSVVSEQAVEKPVETDIPAAPIASGEAKPESDVPDAAVPMATAPAQSEGSQAEQPPAAEEAAPEAVAPVSDKSAGDAAAVDAQAPKQE